MIPTITMPRLAGSYFTAAYVVETLPDDPAIVMIHLDASDLLAASPTFTYDVIDSPVLYQNAREFIAFVAMLKDAAAGLLKPDTFWFETNL